MSAAKAMTSRLATSSPPSRTRNAPASKPGSVAGSLDAGMLRQDRAQDEENAEDQQAGDADRPQPDEQELAASARGHERGPDRRPAELVADRRRSEQDQRHQDERPAGEDLHEAVREHVRRSDEPLALFDLGHHLALGLDRFGEERLELLGGHAGPEPTVEQLLAKGGLVERWLLVDRVVTEHEDDADEQRNREHDDLERTARAEP
jgi:hypothetical protein